MNFTEHIFQEHLAKVYSTEELEKFFRPLSFNFSTEKKRLDIFFPHNFFKKWFEDNIQEDFTGKILTMFPGISIYYGLKKNFTIDDIIKHSDHEPEKKVSLSIQSICLPQIPFPENTFENFLANNKNDFPLEISKDMASNIKKPISNPLILYGTSGSGKTHLLESIINSILSHKDYHCIFYGCIEEFLEFDKNGGTGKFTSFFIDDVNRIFESSTANRYFTTCIDSILRLGKPIVMTTDNHTDSYTELSQKLRTRLNGGILVEIKKPDLDIRRKYIHQMNMEFNLGIDKETILGIAQKYMDFRSITGALTRIKAYRLLIKDSPTDIDKIISVHEKETTLTADKIITTVSEFYSIPKELLCGKSRTREDVKARQIAMYLCRDLLGMSLAQVGHLFSGRDHSSIIYALKKVKENQDTNKVMNNDISKLKNLCLS